MARVAPRKIGSVIAAGKIGEERRPIKIVMAG